MGSNAATAAGEDSATVGDDVALRLAGVDVERCGHSYWLTAHLVCLTGFARRAQDVAVGRASLGCDRARTRVRRTDRVLGRTRRDPDHETKFIQACDPESGRWAVEQERPVHVGAARGHATNEAFLPALHDQIRVVIELSIEGKRPILPCHAQGIEISRFRVTFESHD